MNPCLALPGQQANGALPKTIEEATRRYLHHYSRHFKGPAHEQIRLKNITKAFILKLRKVAPRFYDEKLPEMINQACSTMLMFDTSTQSGTHEFHKCHSIFLRILENLRTSQPAEDVSFSKERERLIEKEKLTKKYLELKAKIEAIEATEIDAEDLGEGEENLNDPNEKLFRELSEHRAELKRISIELAYMEGHQVEGETAFELKVPPRSLLNLLSNEQLKNLEKQMFDLVKENKNKRTAMYVDKSIIDSMIEKLNIEPTLFKKEQLRDITKDALDAYKSYFREIDSRNREQYHEELLDRPSLLPREGILIKHPDDVPDDVRLKFELNERQSKREIDDILESYSKRPCAEEHAGDALEDDEEEEDTIKEILESVRRKGLEFKRVKEEPRDDCEEFYSGDEREVDGALAEALVTDPSITYGDGGSTEPVMNEDLRELEEFEGTPRQDIVKMETCSASDGISNSHDESGEDYDDADDDIEFLGTVEPTDKIKCLELE